MKPGAASCLRQKFTSRKPLLYWRETDPHSDSNRSRRALHIHLYVGTLRHRHYSDRSMGTPARLLFSQSDVYSLSSNPVSFSCFSNLEILFKAVMAKMNPTVPNENPTIPNVSIQSPPQKRHRSRSRGRSGAALPKYKYSCCRIACFTSPFASDAFRHPVISNAAGTTPPSTRSTASCRRGALAADTP